jgi:imidazolonepropionase
VKGEARVLLGRIAHQGPSAGGIEDGALVVEDGIVAFVGRRADLPTRWSPLLDPTGGRTLVAPLIGPGLVDAHTHCGWAGSRHDEYLAKLRGDAYEAIAARGGGIVASMRAVEEITDEALVATIVTRLRRMARLGVTTVEVKSGYGLRPDLELRQLAAIAEAARAPGVPRVVPTLLALHALPPHARASAAARAEYVAAAADLVARCARDGLARFVDAYVDRNAFTVDEARATLRKAREVGLGIRLHVGQFADVGGAELAAELGAASADHLEHVGPRGREALARAGVRAVLLPVASFVLGQAPPDVVALRAAGVRLVVASDANPGTAPTESLPLALAFAARSYGLGLEEALAGATHEAAASLDLQDTGRLVVGARADVVGWDLPHEAALVQPWGVEKTCWVLGAGSPLFEAPREPAA